MQKDAGLTMNAYGMKSVYPECGFRIIEVKPTAREILVVLWREEIKPAVYFRLVFAAGFTCYRFIISRIF
jgi:hypothetical protein